MFKKVKFLLVAVLAMIASVANAQVTTAALTGLVTDGNEPIIGATVQAVHEPSGTHYGTITNIDGRYNIQGMRTGGPYKIEISYVGYQTVAYTGVTLNLGDPTHFNTEMKENTEVLQEVMVIATRSKFSSQKTGASININNEAITNMPTINRSISDIARLSPYANGMSFAGGDGRSTNFTIDGANFNNNFGLSSALPGGGNPISIDAIDEVQVVVAPFDVRQTNFIGGGINAVTKSGTNQFKGTAYALYRNQDMRGNKINGVDLGDRVDESKTTYGFTLGGPIIKDKLFFFVNYENEKTPGQVTTYRARKDGEKIEGNVSRTLLSDMEKAKKHLMDKYGYDPGSATEFPGDESNSKILARIDWNINTNHHMSLRYNNTKNTAWNAPNGNSVDVTPRLNGTYRMGAQSMAFSNSLYSQQNNVQSLSFDFNSHIGILNNQLLATYTNIEDIRGSNSDIFPHVDIMYQDENGVNQLEPYMTFGYELFTYNNGVKNKIYTVKDDVTLLMGNHKLLAGFSFEHQFANNSYMRNGTGYYRYASLDDFLNDRTPESFALTYGYNGVANPTAQVTFNQIGFYVQDDWQVTPRLKMNYGVRFDDMIFDNKDIATNKAIYNLSFNRPEDLNVLNAMNRRIDTGVWPGNKILVSPRIGFSWDVRGDKTLKVRGGVGVFAGRLPLVFFTNMPTNANMVQTTYSLSSANGADLSMFNGGMVTNVQDMIKTLGLQTTLDESSHAAGSKISGVSKDFKLPQQMKTSLAVDYVVPVSFPFTLTGEFMYTKNINATTMENWNIKDPEKSSFEKFNGADNRYKYPSNYAYYKGKNAVVLGNTSKGHGYTFNITANATPIENLSIMAAYTHTASREITGMPGSDPVSAWQGLYSVDGPNTSGLHTSQYVTPDKLIASVNYTLPTKTSINLFYQGYREGGYTYFYSNDMNGDGITGDLMYIPRDKSEIKFKNEEDATAFWKFFEQDSYLKSHKGEYAEAYGATAPWVHRFDLRLSQNFSVKAGKTKHTLQLNFDFMNIGNLINSAWGIAKVNTLSSNGGKLLKYEGVDATNTPLFSFNKVNKEYMTKTWDYATGYSSCWKLQVGVKYIFN